jgi:apolipoprotein N-acyltransferase
MLGGIGQFSISLAWAIQFNTAGYVALLLVEAGFVAVACAFVPPRRGRVPGLVGALVVAEFARESWPFGGLPLGGIALGQMDGPLGLTARLGGPLLVCGVTVLAGASLAALLPGMRHQNPDEPGEWGDDARSRRTNRGTPQRNWPLWPSQPVAAATGIATVFALAAIAAVAPNGTGSAGGKAAAPRPLAVAIVQGGGARGLDQLEVPASVVFAAAVRETRQVPRGVQLIVWPEDVVGLSGPFTGSRAESRLASIARAHGATLVAGVTYPVGTTRFRNEIVAFSPTGRLVATFEKVHRVPFGEYVPDRGFFAHFANLSDIPRDAIAGTGSGMITTPAGRFAVLVSYEDFFSNRGLSSVRAGGRILLVPTNTSSYSSSQAPAQELAASELQAIEEGRYLLQASPTGYSAILDSDGNVKLRTALSVPAVLRATVPLLSGSTWYELAGDAPVLLVAIALLVGGWAATLSRQGRWRRRQAEL